VFKRADERIRLTTRTGRPTGELEDAAASAGILRPESARFNFEFLHSLHGRSCGDRTSILDHGRGAIHHNLFAEGGAPANIRGPRVPFHCGGDGIGETLERATAIDVER